MEANEAINRIATSVAADDVLDASETKILIDIISVLVVKIMQGTVPFWTFFLIPLNLLLPKKLIAGKAF